MKNKGEILLESILSIFIISVSLIPICNAITNGYKYMKKIDLKLNHEINNKNLLEYLKMLNIDYELYKEFIDISEAASYFNIDKNYILESDKSIIVELFKIDDKTFKIRVENYEEVYTKK